MDKTLPIHVRATRLMRKRRSFLFGGTYLSYDVRFANGEVQTGVRINDVLQEARFPADYHSTVNGAQAVAGKGEPGEWVDYPYGRRLPADLAAEFFAQHKRAGLILPDGWYGKPFDSRFTLTRAVTAPNGCTIELEGGRELEFKGTVRAVPTVLEKYSALQLQGFAALTFRTDSRVRTYGDTATYADYGTVIFVSWTRPGAPAAGLHRRPVPLSKSAPGK